MDATILSPIPQASSKETLEQWQKSYFKEALWLEAEWDDTFEKIDTALQFGTYTDSLR
jgi:hypothetical protein